MTSATRPMRLNAETLAELLFHELDQCEQEGYDVAEERRRWAALGLPTPRVHHGVPEAYRDLVRRQAAEIEAIYAALEEHERRRPDFPYEEPSTLEAIRAARPAGPRRLQVRLSDEALRDRMLGAWLGRAA